MKQQKPTEDVEHQPETNSLSTTDHYQRSTRIATNLTNHPFADQNKPDPERKSMYQRRTVTVGSISEQRSSHRGRKGKMGRTPTEGTKVPGWCSQKD